MELDVPIICRTDYTLLNIDGNYVDLLDQTGELKSDVSLPKEDHLIDVIQKMKDIFEDGDKECVVSVLSALGIE